MYISIEINIDRSTLKKNMNYLHLNIHTQDYTLDTYR